MMNRSRAFLVVLAMFAVLLQLPAQKTTVFTEAQLAYKRGEELFQKGVYGYAMTEYKEAIQQLLPANEPEWEHLRMRSELGYAKAAVRLDHPDGEKLILEFIRKYKPDPLASQALLEVANYFYNAQKYDKAIEFYKQINPRELNATQRQELYFKIGYSYFVQKKFKDAEANFKEIKDTEGDYFYPANYYYGLCKFFNNQFADAIKSFRLVERSKDYKPYVPYYISQIYFAQRDYEELIKYAEPKLNDKTLRNLKEMNQLVGQAYFEKGDYKKALPYLEKFAESSGTMREEEFYQLGYCQYQVGQYAKAAKNFEQLHASNTALGQTALYYLGDCELRSKDKAGARNAFGAASKMDFDKDIQQSALINYAKLSYELHYDKEALTALQSIKTSSKYYAESQGLMSEIFVNTRNYDQAISTLEAMPSKTPKLKEAYQKVLYLRGLQHLKDGRAAQAQTLLEKSVDNAFNNEYKALALYWLGDLEHQNKNYNKSIDYVNQFIALAKNIKTLPDESSVNTANYMQGYNYVKKENYSTAQGYFTDAVAGIKRNRSSIKNKAVKDGVLGDATLRAGDCLFKKNNYKEAIKFYDEAITAKYPGFEYALFQKAIIEGLRGNTTDKIIALEDLINKYKTSEFADDALFQLGLTYQDIKQASKATEAFKKLVADYPNSDMVNNALIRLGLVAYNSGNSQAAINYYKQVFSHQPSKEEADAALAALREIYIKDLGDPDGFNAFLETIPGYKLDNSQKDENAFEAAEAAYEKANYDRAVADYTDYIRKYPNGVNILVAYYHRGESYAELKQYDKALNDYEYVVSKGEGNKYYVDAVGKAADIAFKGSKDYKKAYNYFVKWEAVAANANDRFEAQLGAMRSAYKLGDTNAVQAAAKKVSSNPSATDEQVAQANFYIGKIAFDRKEWDGAMQAFNKVLQNSDNELTAEARYLIAEIHYQKRDLEKAKKRCLDNNNDNSNYPYWVGKSLLLLSDVFAEQDDLFSAKTVLEALIENYDDKTDDIIPTAKKKLDALNKASSGSNRIDKTNNFMEEGGN
ncbi:MAG: tetratricopeptide repeat protein [Saprospiraceae bacterium]|nr:tetratricopeptide repeat protein [Saprospiraceae bacterium]